MISKVDKAWIDYNGHMNVAYYVLLFDQASDAFLEKIGVNDTYRGQKQRSFFVAESHITYQREVHLKDEVAIKTIFLGFDEKRIHLFHTMYDNKNGVKCATVEIMLLHMDLVERKVVSMDEAVLGRLLDEYKYHRGVENPKEAGCAIRQLKVEV